MPRQVFVFDPPERFIAGTVGLPGERTFFLQASGDGRTVSVSLEKLQVRVLAERLAELLDTVERAGGATGEPVEDNDPLDTPVEEEFRVGNMGLAWDGDAELCVIEAMAQGSDAEDSDVEPLADAVDGPDALRVRVTAGVARGFVQRAMRVVAAGRPPCPLCGLPLDTEGHVCPRQNGHRR
ncbi:MAG TPA: DUF3090 family protein [Mycobacteriales bacterium]|nr:DUF3090 family protein [Mycobacteriales bacterium]